MNMEAFCTSGPHSKHRAALTSSSFYQASTYSRNLRQNDYSLPNRNRHSTLLWHQKPQQSNTKPRSKISSIVLAAAAFLVFITVLSVAGLALYMGALRSETPAQLLTFTGSAKISRGDRFVNHVQEKSRKYRQQLENLYHRSSIGPALISCIVERFGDDALTLYFRLSLNRKKLSRSISNLEKTLRDILLNDSLSRRPIFRGIRFDPRSVQIRQILDNKTALQKVITEPKETVKSRSGVVLESANKRNLTVTVDRPIKRKTTTELNFKEEDLPVIGGSFHISKTEADITEKKKTFNDNTTHRPTVSDKAKQPPKPTSLKETSVTSALYKIATAGKHPATFQTTRKIRPNTSSNFMLNTNTFSLKTTTIPSKTTTELTASVNLITSTKRPLTINQFIFSVPPHSLDKEPWVPIQGATEIPYEKPKFSENLETSPTVSLIERLHKKQPIYTSFTNPGLSFHSLNTETLRSTSMVGHPLPVNKISVITEPSVTDVISEENYPKRTEISITETSNEQVFNSTYKLEDSIQRKTSIKSTEGQSEAFVEVETLKHVPGSIGSGSSEERTSSPAQLKWELLNGAGSHSFLNNFNQSAAILDKLHYNFTEVQTMKERHSTSEINQAAVLANMSSIFRNLTPSAPLDIIPTSTISSLNNKMFTTATPTTERPNFSETQVEDGSYENTKESILGQGHVEVVETDEESLILQIHASTRVPLVTLIPVKSNSGVGRPLRPKPKRPAKITELVENRSYASDPFYKNLNMDSTELSKGSIKFVQTEVVTSVSSEINRVKVNRGKFNDFKILGVLNFDTESYDSEDTTSFYRNQNNEANKQNLFRKSIVENEAEFVRNPKMEPKENFKNHTSQLQDKVSVFSINSSISANKNEKLQAPFNVLTEEKLKQLSEISKVYTNSTIQESETVVSNKAISASYAVNQAGFKILTKTFNKIPAFSKDEEKKSVLGFNVVSLNGIPNKTECSNFTIKCGDGQCLPDTARCNQLVDCNDGTDEKNCNCADYLKSQLLLRKVCDGVVDCWDFSDENLCEWCKPEQYVCSNSKFCIDKNRICDGISDCPNGDDERQCVIVAPSIQAADNYQYYSEGYLLVRKRGRWGKVCMKNFAQVITELRSPWKVSELGQAVCKAMTYRRLNAIEHVSEPRFVSSVGHPYNERYYELSYTFLNTSKSKLLFKESVCQSGQLIRLQCQILDCGTRPQAINHLARRMYRIVGGSNAGLGAWPWQAALYKEGEFQCGGTLLSDRWLLSAGHCFFHSLEEHWVARLGALRRGTAFPSPYEQLRHIIRIILHPSYVDSGFINDISLLKMEVPIKFSDYVRPICLPSPDSILRHGRICTVIGWGQLFEVGRIFPDTLQEVQIPVISTAECRKNTLFLPLHKITDDMFCAGYERGGRDACLGDSGGPLMCSEPDGHWVLYGITSNGYGCARANRPGVYTKVASYITWIQYYINNSTLKDTNQKSKTICSGHRCPLGECLPKSRLCND